MKYVLAEDLILLKQKIELLQKELFALGDEFHEAVNQSSETWHDNAPFDVVRDKQTLLSTELQHLRSVLRDVRVANTDNKDIVGVGSMVTVSGAKELKLMIGGHWVGRDAHEEYVLVRYDAPIAGRLLGSRLGERVELPLGNFVITSIE